MNIHRAVLSNWAESNLSILHAPLENFYNFQTKKSLQFLIFLEYNVSNIIVVSKQLFFFQTFIKKTYIKKRKNKRLKVSRRAVCQLHRPYDRNFSITMMRRDIEITWGRQKVVTMFLIWWNARMQRGGGVVRLSMTGPSQLQCWRASLLHFYFHFDCGQPLSARRVCFSLGEFTREGMNKVGKGTKRVNETTKRLSKSFFTDM